MKQDSEARERFQNFAIMFSFIVNAVTIFLLLGGSAPGVYVASSVKTDTVEPLLDNLDTAFVGLGNAVISTTITITEPMPIQFNLPLDQPLPIDFQLPIEQNTVVVLQESVPLNNLPARFNLPGGGGAINGTVSLSLPPGLPLPIRLSMSVPVSQTIPVRLNVPVNQMIPINMSVPVRIKLGESGLDPAVEQLRAVFRPLREQVEGIPDLGGEP